MMNSIKFASLVIVMCLSLISNGQTKKEKREQEKIEKVVRETHEKVYGKAEEPTKEYLESQTLVDEAIAALKIGEVNKGDSLINLSISVYPTEKVLDYVAEIFKLSNLYKATTLMDQVYSAIENFPANEILVLQRAPLTYVDGKFVRGLRKVEKVRALYNFGRSAFNVNREFGQIKWSIQMVDKLSQLKITNTSTSEKLDDEYWGQLNMIIYAHMLKGNFDEAIRLNSALPNVPGSGDMHKTMFLIGIYFEMGDYDKAMAIIDEKEEYKIATEFFKFMMYAKKGDVIQATTSYQKLSEMPEMTKSNQTFYYLALIDIKKGDFKNALLNLDSALNFRESGDNAWMGSMMLMDPWLPYKAIGDAYVGLKQFDKARDNYNIALLANQDYEPAIAALTKLESSIATTTSTDKTPPKIAVTEPSVKRGLQVTTSGNDVMVRGIAEDPSGLKSVSINGQSVYAQATGNFWGNIVLKNGLNRITIKATDGAGNIAEETFEITKNNTPSPETEIVAVTAKEGKNYCLLIAAQNYSDATIPSLENPIQDAVRLKIVLKKNYYFTDENIITLFNPSANDIKRQLLELTNIIQPEDNLLIFYAGHGIWVEKEKKGYWLMTDAKRNDPNTWVSNKDVLNLIAKLPSRHTLLITDACFSGGVFKTRSITKDAPSAIQMMDAKVSRVAITSGNDTEVPDESVFMKYLVKALSENKDQYMPAQKMFITHIMEAVMTEGKTEPRYGTLELAGHVGGDFIFIKK